jgi:class 3 adenylate cyclase/tetratricopeptide (TPR) repeat protein
LDSNRKRKPSDLLAYVSSLHASWLASDPNLAWQEIDGTLVFADVSGFTPLTERLARKGKVGAEELTDTLNIVFRELLGVASGFGGDCLKFGGDALLLLFNGDGHSRRGCAAAHAMLGALRRLRRTHAGLGLAQLNMSLSVHSGTVHAFLAGRSHRELIVAGPAVTRTLQLESQANAGQILVSHATAGALDPGDVERLGDAWTLRRTPAAGFLSEAVVSPEMCDPVAGIPVGLISHLSGEFQEGEHRLAAIGFLKFGHCDTTLADAGPSALSLALDDLINQVQGSCVTHGVTLLGTDVDQDGGKVILASGAPSASPDDEDRLLHAIRAVLDEVGRLPVRAGVNRGRIFAVDVGSPERRTFTVMGDAVNLAARVMAKGDWGELVATQDVLDRTRTDFELIDLPPFTVKGKTAHIRAQLVGRPRGQRERTGENDLPLIGRSDELAVIRESIASAHQGEGRIVELVGAPGIGKSKLVASVVGMARGLRLFGVEAGRYSLATPYFALRRALRMATGVSSEAPIEEVEAAVRQTVECLAPDLIAWLPLIGVPFGLDLPDSPDTARLDPAHRQTALQNAVIPLLQRLLPGPTLITIEDAHWLDAASCDLLRQLISNVERQPWAVLATRRDVAGGLQLAEVSGTSTLHLEPLTDEAAASLASAATQGVALPPGMSAELVARSGGNPLFVQELVSAALRSSLSELPDTIEAVVATTIDTLPTDDRALLRQAAVLGSKFPVDILSSMLGVSNETLTPQVRRLQHFLLTDDAGMARFRHVLLRDVAYEGLPFRARRNLHGRAALVLEEAAGTHPEAMAELLSIHFHAAGQYNQTWRYSRVAGERAQHNGAPVEAAAFYARALEAARRLPDVTPDVQADVAEQLGDTWELGGRYDLAEVAYRQARRLAPEDPLRLGGLFRKMGYLRDREGHYSDALRWFGRGLRAISDRDQLEANRLRARLATASGSSKLRQGRHLEAIPLLESAARLAEASGERSALAHAYQQLDWAHSELGKAASADYSEQAVAIYEELGDERGRANSLNQMGVKAYWQGRWDDAVVLYERSAEAGRRAGALVENAIFINNIGEIRSDQGHLDEAEALLQEAHSLWTGGGWRIGSGWAMSNLGRVASRSGRLDEAATRLRQALELFETIKAGAMLLETEAREVERLVLAGEHRSALAVSGQLIAQAKKLGGMANVVNMLERLEGYALCQAGDLRAGWDRLSLSVADARARGADYDAALGLEALARVAPLIGTPDTAGLTADAQAIFQRLGVVYTPAIPLPSETLSNGKRGDAPNSSLTPT